MNNARISLGCSFLGSIVAVVAPFAILSVAGSVLAHGGKGNANSFTALQALQESTDSLTSLLAATS